MRFAHISAVVFLSLISCTQTLACKCAPPPPDLKTPEAVARWTASGADTIFEGQVERSELKWSISNAKLGDLVPADLDLDQESPTMLVSFVASRFYRGTEQPRVTIESGGLGGGDCGLHFVEGEQYLVFAYHDESGQLVTGLCMGTARLAESQGTLAYLRGDPIARTGVEMPRARVCGQMVRKGLRFEDSRVFLFQIGDNSPIPSDEATFEDDGSFCASRVEPGKYRLFFVNPAENPTSAAFFSGVFDASGAQVLELKPGESVHDLVFEVPSRAAFSISGQVRVSDRAALPSGTKVMALASEPLNLMLAYSEDVEANGSFFFPQVLPGKYWVFVSVESEDASAWWTRKAEIDVGAPIRDLTLEITRKSSAQKPCP